MSQFYSDYRWSRGEPIGESPIDDPTGKAHFRFLLVDGGVRLEQFNGAGKFVRLVHSPPDGERKSTTCETSGDCLHRVRRNEDGAVSSYEEYEWPGGSYSDDVYPKVKVFNEHGRLVARHRPEQISDSAWDIHVLDALGKPRMVLHHTNVGVSDSCTIREEWVE